MAVERFGDTGPVPERSYRVFEKNAYYYYRTREGIDIGPFDTKADAERGVNDFIDFMSHGPKSAQALMQYSPQVA
ncbi:DUF6316 family protein [Halioxenophilus aromaticivorans]|uniref:DUF6316 domain-containing protein n=1 Tax=Halioxenophilus aromaticivorans TaxID=1306992 RepID=A0AAV3U6B9_9ALTE